MSEKSPFVAQVCDKWGPHAIMIAWGEEERSLRLSPAACGGARLSGFSDDERAARQQESPLERSADLSRGLSARFPLSAKVSDLCRQAKKDGFRRPFYSSQFSTSIPVRYLLTMSKAWLAAEMRTRSRPCPKWRWRVYVRRGVAKET